MKPFDKEIHQKRKKNITMIILTLIHKLLLLFFFEFRKLSVIYKIRKFPEFELTQIDLRSNNFLSH